MTDVHLSYSAVRASALIYCTYKPSSYLGDNKCMRTATHGGFHQCFDCCSISMCYAVCVFIPIGNGRDCDWTHYGNFIEIKQCQRVTACMMDDEVPVRIHHQTNEMQIRDSLRGVLTKNTFIDTKRHRLPSVSQACFTFNSSMKAAMTKRWMVVDIPSLNVTDVLPVVDRKAIWDVCII